MHCRMRVITFLGATNTNITVACAGKVRLAHVSLIHILAHLPLPPPCLPHLQSSCKPAPTYTLVEPAQRQVLTVAASTRQVRPFACCAILRGMNFDDKVYKSFIDLQDKLHQVGNG